MKLNLIFIILLFPLLSSAQDNLNFEQTGRTPFQIVQEAFENGEPMTINDFPTLKEIKQGATPYKIKNIEIKRKTKVNEILNASTMSYVRLELKAVSSVVPELDNGPLFPSSPGIPARTFTFSRLTSCYIEAPLYLDIFECKLMESTRQAINSRYYGNYYIGESSETYPVISIIDGNLTASINIINRHKWFKDVYFQTETYRKKGRVLVIRNQSFSKNHKLISELYFYAWKK